MAKKRSEADELIDGTILRGDYARIKGEQQLRADDLLGAIAKISGGIARAPKAVEIHAVTIGPTGWFRSAETAVIARGLWWTR